MTEASASTFAHARLAALAASLSEYILRYGSTPPARAGLAALEEALSDYVLRYGLTPQARGALSTDFRDIRLAGLLHEVNASMHGEGAASCAPRP